MKKGRMAEIVKELQGASKMHLKQSKEIAEHIDDMGSPAKKNGYDKVDVQDLQDMGEVKKDKKGKQYVVNERLTGTSKDTLSVGNHYSGRKYKPGELIDETDYEDMSEKANKTAPINKIEKIEKQSLQTKYRKFKAKAGSKVRKLLGEPEPAIIVQKKQKVSKNLMK